MKHIIVEKSYYFSLYDENNNWVDEVQVASRQLANTYFHDKGYKLGYYTIQKSAPFFKVKMNDAKYFRVVLKDGNYFQNHGTDAFYRRGDAQKLQRNYGLGETSIKLTKVCAIALDKKTLLPVFFYTDRETGILHYSRLKHPDRLIFLETDEVIDNSKKFFRGYRHK